MKYVCFTRQVFSGSPILRWISIFALAIELITPAAARADYQKASAQKADAASPAESAKNASPIVVVGFVGGWVRHDNLAHSEVQLAASLQKTYPAGVHVEVFENANGRAAVKKILGLLDVNRDGKLTAAEKQSARIILYGHSWGASEAITVARKLGEEGIPVLLTIQVDSVAKRHENDSLIPANVIQAANFYQANGFVHGENKISAADPTKTKIIGNFKFNYQASPYACTDYPWYDRVLAKAHTEIECDPNVWKQVQSLISEFLPPAPSPDQKY